jgi:hypothetical protein
MKTTTIILTLVILAQAGLNLFLFNDNNKLERVLYEVDKACSAQVMYLEQR